MTMDSASVTQMPAVDTAMSQRTGSPTAERNPHMEGSFAAKLWESLRLMCTVIVSPRRAYNRIEILRPFLLVWIAGCGFAVLQAFSIFHRVGVDAIMRSGLSQMPELKYTAQQIEVMKRNTVAFFPFQLIGTALLWILTIIVVATLLFEIDKRLIKNQRSYKTVLSIVTYAQMPQIFFSIAVCILLSLYPNSSQFNVNALVGTNAGLLVAPQSIPQFFRVFLGSLDVWTIWSIVLVSIGLSSERARLSKTLSYVFGLWFIFVVAKSSVSAMFLHHAVAAAHRTGMGR